MVIIFIAFLFELTQHCAQDSYNRSITKSEFIVSVLPSLDILRIRRAVWYNLHSEVLN